MANRMLQWTANASVEIGVEAVKKPESPPGLLGSGKQTGVVGMPRCKHSNYDQNAMVCSFLSALCSGFAGKRRQGGSRPPEGESDFWVVS